MSRSKTLRRLGAMLLLVCFVSLGTSACILVAVPVPVRGGHHHRW